MSEKMTEAQMLEHGISPLKNKTTMKELSKEQIVKINEWLPKEALTKRFDGMTNIAPWAITARLNDVFGVGKWKTTTFYVEAFGKDDPKKKPHIVTKNTLEIPEYGIYLECFGGNTNSNDIGDAFKGSQTDSLSKMASWLGIGIGIWKGEYNHLTPAFLWGSVEAVKAFNYLGENARALAYFVNKYNVKTLDELTKENFIEIYKILKDKNRI